MKLKVLFYAFMQSFRLVSSKYFMCNFIIKLGRAHLTYVPERCILTVVNFFFFHLSPMADITGNVCVISQRVYLKLVSSVRSTKIIYMYVMYIRVRVLSHSDQCSLSIVKVYPGPYPCMTWLVGGFSSLASTAPLVHTATNAVPPGIQPTLTSYTHDDLTSNISRYEGLNRIL